MDCSDFFLSLREIGFWDTGYIMGGLLGFPSEERMDGTGVGKRDMW